MMINFPGLGIKMQVSKVAFSILEIDVYWYAILIAIPILIFLLAAKKLVKRYEIKYEDILDLFILLIPISLISARLYYVIFSWNYYQAHLSDIFNIRQGGLAIYGGIIGGAITLYVFCKKRKIYILDITDLLVPFLALGQSIGRWGNFINIEAYGNATNLPWRMEILENGITKAVHPTFLYESIATFLIFLFLINKKKKFKGELTYSYLILYSFVRMWIEGLRIDSLMFYGVRISQILSFFLFVIFCSILAKKKIEAKKSKKSPVN